MTENNGADSIPKTIDDPAPTTSTPLPPSSAFPNAVAMTSVTNPAQPQQEWPADPSMYQLVGKIGQGAFATVWKAYRLFPTTTTLETITTTAAAVAAATTRNDTLEISTAQDSQVSSTLNTTNAVSTTTMVTCAVKVLNLDHADSSNLAEIRLEVQAMRLLSHPNVLPCHTAFVNERNLWLITPLMAKGSSLHSLQSIRKLVRRQRRQQQCDDPTTIAPSSTTPAMTIQMEHHIMYILHETIVGLQYIHENLQIHRDIKAGNILIDTDGTIKIADFGVSSFLLLQNGSLYQHEKAKTFVGTPCWMAPEVMEQINGYDYKADIWSLGITALELAKGYAPYAKYPPMKVLILTIQEEPPSLASYEVETGFASTDDEFDDPTGGSRSNTSIIETYSSDFEDFVRLCLQKDPSQRPTCTELLASRHFSDYNETRQRRMDAMRDEICVMVKDVGYKLEERASASSMAILQPATVVATATTFGGNNLEDATVMAGNIPKSAIIQQRVAEVEDRPAGTTWIFATEESLSDTLVTGTGTQHATNDSTLHMTQQERGTDMSLLGTVRRRGSGQQLGLDGEFDDVLAEFDEFERQTGGEHYDRQRQLQQQEEESPLAIFDNISAPFERSTGSTGNVVDVPNESIVRNAMAGPTTEDDLDQFMDEFEQNTGGEDFRRTT